MITYVAFQPQPAIPWSAQITLDGLPYTIAASWAIWGQRWYFSLTSAAGVLIVFEPILGSNDAVTGSLVTMQGARIATTMGLSAPIYQNQLATSVNIPYGTYIASPVINGTFHMTQPATASGTDGSAVFSSDLNLIAGYGFTTTLVFRDSSQQFEINDSPPPVLAVTIA